MTDAPAKLRIADKDHELSTVPSTIGDVGLDIGALRSDTGFVTFDPGYANTASTESNITYIDGGNGTLWHRGYKIEDLAENCGFLEVAYLLLFGELPDQDALDAWRAKVRQHTLLNEELKRFFDAFPRSAHPMAILSSATNAISTFYEAYYNPKDPDAVRESATRLIAKMPTVAAWAYKKSIGQPYIYPRNDLSYVENFLHMMFALPVEDSPVDKVVAQALNVLLILHADHGQNCSTATVRFVGSSQANLFASVAAGMNALWGPLHGGANQEVVEMLHAIHVDPDMTVEKAVSRAKDKDDPYRLMGFGHRIYRNYDPRAKILKRFADDVLGTVSRDDPLLEIANHLEKVALEDDYFVSRKLYPNVDFYSGLIYQAMGFPVDMFTVLFAIPRMSGWLAHWQELLDDKDQKISRPRQWYTGVDERNYVPLDDR